MRNNHSRSSSLATWSLAFAAGIGMCEWAQADDGPRAPQVPLLASYESECAACHVAYPPGMLVAAADDPSARALRHRCVA